MSTARLLAILILSLTSAPALPALAQLEPLEPMPPELRVAPAPGRRAASAGSGGFCSAATVEPLGRADVRVGRLRDVLELRRIAAGEGTFSFENTAHLQTVARMTCAHRSDPGAAAWLTSYRQVLINGADLDDATIDGLLRASLSQTGRTWDFGCAASRREGEAAPRSTLPPLPLGATPDVALRRELLLSLVCDPNRVKPLGELIYWMDRPGGPDGPNAELPNVMRAVIVRIALATHQYRLASGPAEVRMGSAFTGWVIAGADVTAIDLAAARRELASSGFGPDEQVVGLARIARIRVAGLAIGQAWREAAAQIPGMESLVDELPGQARAAWAAEASAHAQALADAYAVETAWLAHDTRALQGCDTRMRAHWLAYARAQRPTTEAEVRALFDRPAGYLIGAAMMRCELELGRPGRAQVLFEILGRLVPQRGSRLAAVHALRRSVTELRERDPRFPISVEAIDPTRQIDYDADWVTSAHVGSWVTGEGIVGQVQRDGDELHITFRRATAQVPVYQCTPTGRIARIDREGRVEYEERCVRAGERTVDTTPEPVIVPADMAHGVAVGAWLHEQRGSEQALHGYPLEVRERPGTDPSAYLGVPLR